MKKIMVLAAMLAMVLTAAAPALAQVEQGFEQDTDSGDVDQTFTVTGGGSNGSSCAPLSGTSQTGNVQDATGTTSFDSDIEDFEQEEIGSDLSVSGGGSSTECKQEVNQAAAAGSPKAAPAPAPKAAPKVAPAPAPKAAPAPAPVPKAAPAPAPKAEVKAETPEAKAAAPAPAPAPKMEEKKMEEKKEKELPKTGGGTASLLTLGAGALLVGGGLLARRMTR